MSERAMSWANDLPYGVVGPLAYRVLLKLADVATRDGRRAWRSKVELADELQVSPRSVQRAFRELEDTTPDGTQRGADDAGLIVAGDQRHVAHIRGDKRPTVYDLPHVPQPPQRQPQPMAGAEAISGNGETQRGDNAVDNPSTGRQLVSPERTTSIQTDKAPRVSRRARELTPAEACAADSAAGILRPHRWSRLGFCANGCGAESTAAA